MAALSNHRHEAFAREVAKGQSASAAYKAAGYQAKGSSADVNASRLLRNAKVKARVAELQQLASTRTELTVAKITEDLLRLAKQGEAFQSESGTNAARQCLMDAAKLNGMIVDKVQSENVNYAVSAEPIDDVEEWLDQARPN